MVVRARGGTSRQAARADPEDDPRSDRRARARLDQASARLQAPSAPGHAPQADRPGSGTYGIGAPSFAAATFLAGREAWRSELQADRPRAELHRRTAPHRSRKGALRGA